MPQIPAGWEETTLGEIADITMGQSPKWETYNDKGDGIPFYQWITEFWEKFVRIKTYSSQPIKIVEPNTILFSVRAPVWKINITKHKACIGRWNAWLFMKNKEQEFLFYLLKYLEKQFLNRSSGTVFDSINRTEIENLPIHLPPLPEQQAIAAVLSSFDDKIELLRAENQTLEQMGQELFKERFGKWKVGDELPEGWRVGKIEDLTNYIASWGTPATKEASYYGWRINWFSTKELQDCFLFSSEKTITEDALKNSSAKEFPKDTVLMAIYAAPTVWRLWILTQSSAFNQAAVGLVAKDDIWMPFIYLLLKFHRDNFNNLANWAAQQNLNVSLVKNYEIPIPDQETLNQFDLVIKPLFNKIRANSEQIQSLSATRDLLLPKLMSGEVRVEF